jgi:hypothetical protein
MSPIRVWWALKERFQSEGTFGSRRKISSLTIHPIDDKDNQSAKNQGELSEHHLWDIVELGAWCQPEDNINT